MSGRTAVRDRASAPGQVAGWVPHRRQGLLPHRSRRSTGWRGRGWSASLGLSLLVTAPLSGQEGLRPDLRPVRVLYDEGLHPVQGVAFADSLVLAVSGLDPFVHVFGPDGHVAWGKRGSGPAELRSPTQIRVRADSVFVLDLVPGAPAIGLFDLGGRNLNRILIRGSHIASRFGVGGNNLVVEVREFGRSSRWLMRMSFAGNLADTIAELVTAPMHRIQPAGGPGYSVVPPYRAMGRWTVTSAGELVIWNGSGEVLDVLDLRGESRRQIPLKLGSPIPVRDADREEWFATQIPSNLQGPGTDPLRLVRTEARKILTFPETFPLVMDLVDDAESGVWVRRSPSSAGEVWELQRPGRRCDAVTLAPGKRVLAFGLSYLAVWTRDPETDLERVELLDRDRAVRCRPDP